MKVTEESLLKYQKKIWEILCDWVNHGESGLLIAQLPTGYGKTYLSSFLAQNLEQLERDRLIHAAPTRTLVEAIVEKIKALTRDMNLEVGLQMMYDSQDPFFIKDVVVTTFPSFGFNALRLPVAELPRFQRRTPSFGHFDFPISNILESIVVLDEVHLPLFSVFQPDIGSGQVEFSVFSYVLATTLAYIRAGVPILYLSATYSPFFLNFLTELCQSYGILCEIVKYKKDEQFEKNPRGQSNYKTYYMELEDDAYFFKFLEKTIDNNENAKIGIILNTIRGKSDINALNVASWLEKNLALDNEDILLLHSQFSAIHKSKKIEKLEAARITVATQVIEVGVDISFDIMISELAPPPSLIQRAGRLARSGGDGCLYIVDTKNPYPYGEHILDLTRAWLKHNSTGSHENFQQIKIDWKYPEPREEYKFGTNAFLGQILDPLLIEKESLLKAVLMNKEFPQMVLTPYIDYKELLNFAKAENFQFFMKGVIISLLPVESPTVLDLPTTFHKDLIPMELKTLRRYAKASPQIFWRDDEGRISTLMRKKDEVTGSFQWVTESFRVENIPPTAIVLVNSAFYDPKLGLKFVVDDN